MTATPPPADLLDLGLRAARAASAHLLEAVRRTHHESDTKTSATDLVTATDREVERLVVDTLLGARPDDGIDGEEGANRQGTSGVHWLVDPIDGTTNFWYGLPGFNVSIAASVDGEVVAGVVVDPLHGEEFTATRGGGAHRNGEPIRCTDRAELALALVVTGFSYDPERRRRQALVLTEVLPRVRDIRRLGAAASDLCQVACGRVDAFYEKGLNPWDYAAGALIATEAGAVVGDLDGGPPSGAFTLAAAPAIFDGLRALLVASGAAGA